MKIGVVADTHSQELPKKLIDGLKSVDMVIHAGDFCSEEDYKFFSSFKNFKAVFGNMDEPALKKKLPEYSVFDCEGTSIGLYHGEGPAQKVIEYVKDKFKEEKVDVVIFGHSHEPLNEMVDGVLYFNPGSPNDIVFAPYQSYGVLEIKDGNVSGEIVKIKD